MLDSLYMRSIEEIKKECVNISTRPYNNVLSKRPKDLRAVNSALATIPGERKKSGWTYKALCTSSKWRTQLTGESLQFPSRVVLYESESLRCFASEQIAFYNKHITECDGTFNQACCDLQRRKEQQQQESLSCQKAFASRLLR